MSNTLIKVGNSRISPREITKIDIVPNKGVILKDPRGRVLAWVGEEMVGKEAVDSLECLDHIADLFETMRANPRKAVQPDWGSLCNLEEEAKTKNTRKRQTSESTE